MEEVWFYIKFNITDWQDEFFRIFVKSVVLDLQGSEHAKKEYEFGKCFEIFVENDTCLEQLVRYYERDNTERLSFFKSFFKPDIVDLDGKTISGWKILF